MRDLLIPKPFLPEMRGEESAQCNADSDSRLKYSGALLIKIEDLAPESYLYYPSLEDLEADLDYLAQLFILPGSSESRPGERCMYTNTMNPTHNTSSTKRKLT